MNKFYLKMTGPLLLLVVWFIVTAFEMVSSLMLPAPQDVFSVLIQNLQNGLLINDFAATLFRTAVAFIGAMAIGIPIGLIMGYFNKVYNALEFLVDFFRSLPATALFPLFILFFGIGDAAKIFVALWSSALIIMIYAMYGVHFSNKVRIAAAKVMHIRGFSLFKKILLPGAMPQILAGARVSVSLILAIVIVTEMFIGTSTGLGHRIMDAQSIFNIPLVYASILLAGFTGYGLNRIVERIKTFGSI